MYKLCCAGLLLVVAGVVAASSAFAQDTPSKGGKTRHAPDQLFKKLTGDSSGQTELTLDKFLSVRKFKDDDAKEKATSWFKKADTDGNGTLSLQEFTTAAQSLSKHHKHAKTS
jgi:Ca2+-binding EF-hand superfamily protein